MGRLTAFALIALFIFCAAAWSQVYQAGTTYYPVQHNGSCGRMVSEDEGGFVHVVWTKGLDLANLSRHVYYNVWDPESQAFVSENGTQIDNETRAGFVTLAMPPGGFCYPAFNSAGSDGNAHACVGMDFIGGSGSFTASCPAWMYEDSLPLPIVWPKIAIDALGVIHMIATENPPSVPNPDPRMRVYYARGIPEFDGDGYGLGVDWEIIDGVDLEFLLMDTTTTVSPDIATSPDGSRVAIAWFRPRRDSLQGTDAYDTDLYVKYSEDGGLFWSQPVNLTGFIPADWACYEQTGDWRCCTRDTLRTYPDLSVMFDEENVLHIAFTTVGYYEWMGDEAGPFMYRTSAQIWHWSEQTGEFDLIAESWLPEVTRGLPVNYAMVCRPSLSLDSTTGFLYCSYLQYDTAAYSTADQMNADVFVSVSSDLGATWSVGTNITRTSPPQSPAPNPQNQSEVDPTLSLRTSADHLNLFYELDHAAGTDLIGEPLFTIKEMLLRRVPLDSIPTTPLMPERPFHVTVVPCGVAVGDHNPALPTETSLSVFPNPFNSSANLVLELPAAGEVDVIAYDITGREAARIEHGMRDAGRHVINWTPQALASGIYFVRLESAEKIRIQKVMYLK